MCHSAYVEVREQVNYLSLRYHYVGLKDRTKQVSRFVPLPTKSTQHLNQKFLIKSPFSHKESKTLPYLLTQRLPSCKF